MNRSLARSSIYNILSLCLTYPDREVFSWIVGGEWIKKLRESLSLLTEKGFDEYLQSFKEILARNKDDLSIELIREYTQLFITASPHVVVPPCGGVYLEGGKKNFGRSTAEVLKFYHELGCCLKEDPGDLPDHIAHELEFMAHQTGKEAQVSGSEKVRLEEVQITFMTRFLQPWVSEFCQKVIQQSHSAFYRVLGKLTKDYIQLEKNYLGIPEEMDSHNDREIENKRGINSVEGIKSSI